MTDEKTDTRLEPASAIAPTADPIQAEMRRKLNALTEEEERTKAVMAMSSTQKAILNWGDSYGPPATRERIWATPEWYIRVLRDMAATLESRMENAATNGLDKYSRGANMQCRENLRYTADYIAHLVGSGTEPSHSADPPARLGEAKAELLATLSAVINHAMRHGEKATVLIPDDYLAEIDAVIEAVPQSRTHAKELGPCPTGSACVYSCVEECFREQRKRERDATPEARTRCGRYGCGRIIVAETGDITPTLTPAPEAALSTQRHGEGTRVCVNHDGYSGFSIDCPTCKRKSIAAPEAVQNAIDLLANPEEVAALVAGLGDVAAGRVRSLAEIDALLDAAHPAPEAVREELQDCIDVLTEDLRQVRAAHGLVDGKDVIYWHAYAQSSQDSVRDLMQALGQRPGAAREGWRPEVCICAAIQLPDGQVFNGHRHDGCIEYAGKTLHHQLHLAKAEDVPGLVRQEIANSIQGFTTSSRRFVDRVEAAELQKRAGVRSIQTGEFPDLLFSEDLY